MSDTHFVFGGEEKACCFSHASRSHANTSRSTTQQPQELEVMFCTRVPKKPYRQNYLKFRKSPQSTWWNGCQLLGGLEKPYGGLRPCHQKSSCITQLIEGPYLDQIWSSCPQNRGVRNPCSPPCWEDVFFFSNSCRHTNTIRFQSVFAL